MATVERLIQVKTDVKIGKIASSLVGKIVFSVGCNKDLKKVAIKRV